MTDEIWKLRVDEETGEISIYIVKHKRVTLQSDDNSKYEETHALAKQLIKDQCVAKKFDINSNYDSV